MGCMTFHKLQALSGLQFFFFLSSKYGAVLDPSPANKQSRSIPIYAWYRGARRDYKNSLRSLHCSQGARPGSNYIR